MVTTRFRKHTSFIQVRKNSVNKKLSSLQSDINVNYVLFSLSLTFWKCGS